MTYYDLWFKEFVKSKNVQVHFFRVKVNFCIYLDNRIKLDFIELCLTIRITFVLKILEL